MRLAFLLLVHRYPEQASLLVKTLLADKDAHIYIHVDGKAKETYSHLHREFGINKQVTFTSKRYRVYWGSFNQIRATLQLINDAAKGNHDYYSLLSGQDFPIKPLVGFKHYLQENKGSEFISHFSLPNPDVWVGNGGLDRMRLYWVDVRIPKYSYTFGRINGLAHRIQNALGIRRKIKIKYFGGANWFTLSNAAIQYINTFVASNPGFVKRFKHTRCADEIVVQTILCNAPVPFNLNNNDLRYINWSTGPEYPKILRTEDYNTLVNTPDKFFARKFDTGTDGVILKKLSENFIALHA